MWQCSKWIQKYSSAVGLSDTVDRGFCWKIQRAYKASKKSHCLKVSWAPLNSDTFHNFQGIKHSLEHNEDSHQRGKKPWQNSDITKTLMGKKHEKPDPGGFQDHCRNTKRSSIYFTSIDCVLCVMTISVFFICLGYVVRCVTPLRMGKEAQQTN